MFDISLKFDNIDILSIEKEDIDSIKTWYNSIGIHLRESGERLNSMEFYERFLEYYVGEGEFFLKIMKDHILIGVLKGRIEFGTANKVWIGCYALEGIPENENSQILNNIMGYFKKCFGISVFETGILKSNHKLIKFWENNKFFINRICRNFYKIDGTYNDMVILLKKD